MDAFEEKWAEDYPQSRQAWRRKWNRFMPFLDDPA